MTASFRAPPVLDPREKLVSERRKANKAGEWNPRKPKTERHRMGFDLRTSRA